MGLRRIVAVLVCVAAVGAPSAPAAEAATSPENRALQLINASRRNSGVKPLTRNAKLDAIAERHSRRMRAAGDIWHNRKLPQQVSFYWKALGENVGQGQTVRTLHRAFMRSPGHRRNILKPRYDQIGIGIVVASNGLVYETQVFVDR